MSDIEWRELPEAGHRESAPIAALLKDRPGQWALIQSGSAGTISGTAAGIRTGRVKAWQPGSFEAVTRSGENGLRDLYARYVGENGEHA